MPIKFSIEIHENKKYISVPATQSFTMMISALKTILGLKIISLHTLMAWITDDCYGRFEIEGKIFDIDTVFSDFYVLIPHDENYPDDVYDKISNAFKSYEKPWYRFV